MQQHGIRARPKRRFRHTTHSGHPLPVAVNRVNQDFQAIRPNQCWLSDITYVQTREGWLYLAAILDLFSRRIIGWCMQPTLSRTLVLDALRMAIHQRKPKGGLVHHSDRGIQYASRDYQKILRQFQMESSMSRQGNCWDNAPMESFFGTLKTELRDHFPFVSRSQARQVIFEYIEGFYNRKRLHSSLGYCSPVHYEQLHHPLT
jgi:transposase InsO family protein